MSETSSPDQSGNATPAPGLTPEPAAPAKRKPRRIWRFVRRFTVTCLVLLLVLLAGHWVWGRAAARKLAAAVAEFERAGEPMTAAALESSAVPPADNAALPLRAAAERIDRNDSAWDEASRLKDLAPPLTEAETAVIRKALAPHDETRAEVRRARRERRGADWQVPLRSPLIKMDVPHVAGQRYLALLLSMAALDEHGRGNDAEAVELVRDVLFVARCNEHLPGLLPHVVALGIARSASDRAGEIAPELRVADGGGPTGRAAAPEQVDALARELLDDVPIREGYLRALRVERVTQLEVARGIGAGSMPFSALTFGRDGWWVRPVDGVVNYVAKPTVYDDGRLMLRHTTGVIEAVRTSRDWQAAKAKLGDPWDEVQGKWFLHLVASRHMSGYERTTSVNYQVIAEARLAAVALAARRFALDHDGRLPEKLDDLVPKYLPSVPLDSMAAGDTPLRYVGPAADAERPRAYSVGLNGRDDGGVEVDGDAPLRERERTGDFVQHLKRQPRAEARE
ncbi:MAG TPA: hypothetical protein VFB66_28780 [Tepidisphaeraceae bacterium]|nr:hypothetical protein [Tepidisphaeraceae bacterium]